MSIVNHQPRHAPKAIQQHLQSRGESGRSKLLMCSDRGWYLINKCDLISIYLEFSILYQICDQSAFIYLKQPRSQHIKRCVRPDSPLDRRRCCSQNQVIDLALKKVELKKSPSPYFEGFYDFRINHDMV